PKLFLAGRAGIDRRPMLEAQAAAVAAMGDAHESKLARSRLGDSDVLRFRLDVARAHPPQSAGRSCGVGHARVGASVGDGFDEAAVVQPAERAVDPLLVRGPDLADPRLRIEIPDEPAAMRGLFGEPRQHAPFTSRKSGTIRGHFPPN